MEENSLTDQLFNTKFGIEFVKVLTPLIAKHLKLFLENGSIDYENIGTVKELKLKEIAKIYGLLQTSVSDLELVLIFLKIEDRKLLKEIYPSLESQEQYFKYQLENYIIRVITITDIVGKLGNLLYELEIPEEKCNGYSFKEKVKSVDLNCSLIIEKLLNHTKEIKSKRHSKLHTGDTKIGYFEGIIFWDELSNIIKKEADPILVELTDNNIKEEIELLEKDIRYIIELIVEFTDYVTNKFLEIVEK